MSAQIQSVPKQTFFLKLPAEIRNAVYELLVIKRNPIVICSPRRKHVVNRELTSKSFSVLLRLNKQINTEASSIFYSKNRFVLGNGPFGSTIIPNSHGMKAFLERVPRECLANIKDVVVEVQAHELGSLNDASNLHSLSRALGTHFKALERVQYLPKSGPSLFVAPGNPGTKRLTKDETTKELEKTLLLLMKNPNVKDIQTFNYKWVNMEGALNKILSEKPYMANILKERSQPQKQTVLMA